MSSRDGPRGSGESPRGESRKSIRIAVVDDDRAQAETVADSLRLERFGEVVTLTSGSDLINTYRSFDVVILDLDLGEWDGIDLAEEILIHQPDKWIFVLSGQAAFLSRLRQRELSLVDVIDKPVLEPAMANIVGQMDELARKKWLRFQYIDRVIAGLEAAANATGPDVGAGDIVAAQRGLADAKTSFRTHLLPTSRLRTAQSGPSVRRSILLLLWAVLQRLSFVPSEEFRLRSPAAHQLRTLANAVRLLYQSGLTYDDEHQVDAWLSGSGLWPGRGVRLDEPTIYAVDEDGDATESSEEAS